MPDISPKYPLDVGDGRWALAMIDELRARGAIEIEVGEAVVKATFASAARPAPVALPDEPMAAAKAYADRYPEHSEGIARLEALMNAGTQGDRG